MAWVEFKEDYDFTPKADRRVTLAYKAGTRVSVTTECATRAIAKGKAFRIRAPSRGEAPTGEPLVDNLPVSDAESPPAEEENPDPPAEEA